MAPKNTKKKPTQKKSEPQEYVGKEYSLDDVDKAILQLRLQHPGITDHQIADELGYSRSHVTRRQNKEGFKKAKAEYSRSAEQILKDAVKNAALKMAGLLQCKKPATERLAARDILVNAGVMKIKFDMDHHFPEPFIVETSDGKQTVMGQKERDATTDRPDRSEVQSMDRHSKK
jgi:hypothetical protein